MREQKILRVTAKMLIPYLLLFALYVQFHGDYGPGGGFQAGAIVAASVILYALLEGEAAALRALPMHVLKWLVAGGALLYGAVGVAGLFFAASA